jgi:molybdopterin molybdotransferase
VLTGAPMPPGTDTVALQEEAAVEGDRLLVPAGLKAGANRRRAGEDVRRGQPVLEPGQRLAPSTWASPPSSGFAELRVRQPLDVAVFSTGDELVPPAAPCPKAASTTRTASSYRAAGRPARPVRDLGILPDDPRPSAPRSRPRRAPTTSS